MSEYEAMCMLGLDELAQYVPEEAWPLLRKHRRKEEKHKDKQDGSESNDGYLVQTH